MNVIVDLCVVPLGVGVSVSNYIAACERVLKDAGLEIQLHAYGTNIEGEWEAVFGAIRRCHEAVHELGAPRISTTIKLGTRTDRKQTMEDKIRSVEEKLAGVIVDQELLGYYSRRAREYDSIYEKPERQADLAELRHLIVRWLEGHEVLELACGTGYWTERLSGAAASIVATDASESVLDVARGRQYRGSVEFRRADALRPREIAGRFSAVFAAFWISHLARDRVGEFFDEVEAHLGPGGLVVLLDNRYVEGSSSPLSRRDAAGDTYQERRLESGEIYEVRKNFFEAEELATLIGSRSPELVFLPHYWAARYRVGT